MKDRKVLIEGVAEMLDTLGMHMDLASHWDAKVVKRREKIKELYRNHSEEQMRGKFKVDYDLNDYLDNYRMHSAEVQRYSAMIQGVTAAYQFLVNLPAV